MTRVYVDLAPWHRAHNAYLAAAAAERQRATGEDARVREAILNDDLRCRLREVAATVDRGLERVRW